MVLDDGAIRDVRVSYVPDHDDDGRVRGFVALVTDTTETKAVERALRRSERLLEQSQATAQVGSWELTYDEGLSEVLSGYGREDDIRRSRDAGFDHHLVKPIDLAQLQRIALEVSGRRS